MTVNYRGILTLEIIGVSYRGNFLQKKYRNSFITLAPGEENKNKNALAYLSGGVMLDQKGFFKHWSV